MASGAVETLEKIDADPVVRGQVLLAKGYVLAAELGRFNEAVDAFGQALTLAGTGSSQAEERLHVTAIKNLAMALSDSGSLADQRTALLYIRQAHKLLRGRDRCPERYRLFWVEALVWARTGSHAKALRLLRRALEGFEFLRLPWEIALVGLDLAAVLHLIGEVDKLVEFAEQTFKRFQVLSGADKATLVVLRLWVDAIRAVVEKDDPPIGHYDEKHAEARQVILAGIARGACCKSGRRGTL